MRFVVLQGPLRAQSGSSSGRFWWWCALRRVYSGALNKKPDCTTEDSKSSILCGIDVTVVSVTFALDIAIANEPSASFRNVLSPVQVSSEIDLRMLQNDLHGRVRIALQEAPWPPSGSPYRSLQ